MESAVETVPELGELVMATAREITSHGVYVTLDEYDGMRAFLHISEVATGWVRHIERFVRPGQKVVAKVIRVNKVRREVDISLKQVTGEENKAKLIEVKRDERARTILEFIRSRAGISKDVSSRYVELLESEFDSVFDIMEDVARKGLAPLQKINLPESYSKVFEEVVKEKVVIPKVSVKGTMEAIVNLSDGVEVLRRATAAAESIKTSGSIVKVTYLGAPKYRVVVKADNYKIAEKTLAAATQKAGSVIESSKGSFKFSRED